MCNTTELIEDWVVNRSFKQNLKACYCLDVARRGVSSMTYAGGGAGAFIKYGC